MLGADDHPFVDDRPDPLVHVCSDDAALSLLLVARLLDAEILLQPKGLRRLLHFFSAKVEHHLLEPLPRQLLLVVVSHRQALEPPDVLVLAGVLVLEPESVGLWTG